MLNEITDEEYMELKRFYREAITTAQNHRRYTDAMHYIDFYVETISEARRYMRDYLQ